MKLDIDTPLDSYSLAAMARTEDILGFLVEDLNVVGSKDAFKNILYGVRLIVEGKNRRLSDFSEIINEDDDENIDQNDKSTDSFRINVFRENLMEDIIFDPIDKVIHLYIQFSSKDSTYRIKTINSKLP